MGGTDESVSLFSALDPKSLLLSQFSSADHPQFLQLTTEGFLLERGPRYKAYADLRESKLRMKHMKPPVSEEEELILTPPKKQVKFQGSMATPPRRSKGASVLAQSVPDFSGRFVGGVGSKSLNSGDKRSGGLMSRKSYANLEEFKGLASAARNAINGDNRAGNGRRGGKTVLGYRQL
nr:ATP-dependent RNA helicase [Ipomoea batatas]GMD49404.1 ATP-dependent RNA helicase [Ipomoea batatas]